MQWFSKISFDTKLSHLQAEPPFCGTCIGLLFPLSTDQDPYFVSGLHIAYLDGCSPYIQRNLDPVDYERVIFKHMLKCSASNKTPAAASSRNLLTPRLIRKRSESQSNVEKGACTFQQLPSVSCSSAPKTPSLIYKSAFGIESYQNRRHKIPNINTGRGEVLLPLVRMSNESAFEYLKICGFLANKFSTQCLVHQNPEDRFMASPVAPNTSGLTLKERAGIASAYAIRAQSNTYLMHGEGMQGFLDMCLKESD